MNPLLSRNLFFVKEHVGMFKAANEFDVLDPQTGQPLMEVREPNLGMLTKILRFTDWKRMTPFDVIVKDTNGPQVVRITRGGKADRFTSIRGRSCRCGDVRRHGGDPAVGVAAGGVSASPPRVAYRSDRGLASQLTRVDVRPVPRRHGPWRPG